MKTNVNNFFDIQHYNENPEYVLRDPTRNMQSKFAAPAKFADPHAGRIRISPPNNLISTNQVDSTFCSEFFNFSNFLRNRSTSSPTKMAMLLFFRLIPYTQIVSYSAFNFMTFLLG